MLKYRMLKYRVILALRRAAPLMAALPLIAAAQVPPPTSSSASLYAVNSAALASAMTYCNTRHGNLRSGSPGHACFTQARELLAEFGLRQTAEAVDARCKDPATFNTCLTPEIAKLVHALNAEFAKRGL